MYDIRAMPNQDKYLNLRCLIKFLLKKAQLLALFRSTFDHFYKILTNNRLNSTSQFYENSTSL
jgi:hypothetical protein